MYKHLLIPTDGSDLAAKAVRHGIACAKAIGARVTVMMASSAVPELAAQSAILPQDMVEFRRRREAYAAEVFCGIIEEAKAAGVACDTRHVEESHPYEAIIATAQSEGCDLIVMASHGRRGVSAIVLGSETVKVLTHSTIPVLVYR
ncbi:MAG: universal stress protein [Acetobacteraceae bacterium]|nr:universal stress protein [Acetobacteraceae bacterium]